MSGAFLLFRLSLKRVWMLLCATGLLLAAFQVLRVLIAASVHNAGEFEQIAALLPPFVRAILGPSLTSVMSFNGIVCGGYFDLGIVIALLALTIALATLPASEIETGFADLILARPMPRHWLITRTIALVLFSILLMLLMIMAGTWAGLALFAPPDVPWPPARQTGSLALNLGMLLLCWSGVAMAFGAACRRGVAGAATVPARVRRLAPGLCSTAVAAPRVRRLAVAISVLQPRSNWSWAAHCPWKISWCSGRLP